MQLTETLASMCQYQAKSHRSLCMPRVSTKTLREYLSMAKENEALMALVAVIAMTVFLEVYQWL